MDNLILDTDSYKASHYKQYPNGTQGLFSYLESRGGKYDRTVFFGLQYLLQAYLTGNVTQEDVDEAAQFFKAHGTPFPYEGWKYIAKLGYLPIRIRAVKEGSIVPVNNVLLTVESTDPAVFWVVSWIETFLMRLWYPITVATQSYMIRQDILDALEQTADNPAAEIDFKLHDFGSRGVSSRESAMIGGAAHLVNFKGSDTVAGVWCANRHYNEPMAAFSIPAAEHSTITAWGEEGEQRAYENMLDQFAGQYPIIAVVSDSYNLERAVKDIWGGALKQRVIECGSTIVVRPDSGDPVKVVYKTVYELAKTFGTTTNSKGYKVLNNIRVIQGDGVNQESIVDILAALMNNGFSASNIAFGMGGALLQQVNRDTQRFAYKASAIKTAQGIWKDVCKNPVTDPTKRSKAGRLYLVRDNKGKYQTVANGLAAETMNELDIVYENGTIFRYHTLADIRERVARG